MNRHLNVIDHIDCIEQIEKMYEKLARKENCLIEQISTNDELLKKNKIQNEEIIRLKSLLNEYKNKVLEKNIENNKLLVYKNIFEEQSKIIADFLLKTKCSTIHDVKKNNN